MKELEHDPARDATSVLDYVLTSHEYRNALLTARTRITEELSSESNADRKAKLESNLAFVEKDLLTCHGEPERATEEAVGMLRVLGFDEHGEQAPLNSLSGGLRMRVALACAFFINPDILLLDEPTNHLVRVSIYMPTFF